MKYRMHPSILYCHTANKNSPRSNIPKDSLKSWSLILTLESLILLSSWVPSVWDFKWYPLLVTIVATTMGFVVGFHSWELTETCATKGINLKVPDQYKIDRCPSNLMFVSSQHLSYQPFFFFIPTIITYHDFFFFKYMFINLFTQIIFCVFLGLQSIFFYQYHPNLKNESLNLQINLPICTYQIFFFRLCSLEKND